jgi:hypothetical protein
VGARVWLFLICAGAAVVGCEAGASSVPAKIAGCAQDYECKSDKPGRYCVEGTCVECRGDEDCKLPKMCGQQHTCFVP